MITSLMSSAFILTGNASQYG